MLKTAAIFSLLTLAACIHGSEPAQARNKQCVSGEECKVSGLLTMSTDGHGYIGKLDVGGGKCLNVSIPDGDSKKLITRKAAQKATLTGRWLPYVKEFGLAVTVNGRTIGEGLCGDHYLFVR